MDFGEEPSCAKFWRLPSLRRRQPTGAGSDGNEKTMVPGHPPSGRTAAPHPSAVARPLGTMISVCLRTAEHIPDLPGTPGGPQRLFPPVAQARIQACFREANADLSTKPKHCKVGFDNTTRPKTAAAISLSFMPPRNPSDLCLVTAWPCCEGRRRAGRTFRLFARWFGQGGVGEADEYTLHVSWRVVGRREVRRTRAGSQVGFPEDQDVPRVRI
ncbi:unnamed protein product [Mycena citricolor]|uniref:Uncharacterized protein n=1 Tax=Mycena citricolor TaxID=2018698 RepID=A0AAD2HK34_9AGAR|nr:unnamed protein product [Mycena citricolor]